jgi:hypothetical protein
MRSTALSRTTRKGDVMKELIAVFAFCLALGGVADKGTYKATKTTVKGTGKVLKHMF